MARITHLLTVFLEKQKNILLVEDDKNLSFLLGEHLQGNNLNPTICHDGKTALKKFEINDIDLCILDIVLPDIHGKEVYRKIMEVRPDLKVIVCSGYTVDGPAQEILDEGAQGFIQKPFSLTTISEKLKAVWEAK